MSVAVYERPALQEIGDFGKLTKTLPVGDCTDFQGFYSYICLY
ncbi:lasso RiPP family leader peptide-containing protein [Kitasatospora acidiphila]|uniref:Lasso RiPP family leader peptide-containing protein n=1 Tax=Kitasatospora acidiphila TaxID=2567942 RepID=A0A540W7B6_9ACTN|nr:lasso RiPP family leader peptide-containing protein [Kitasatospora acidiphila]TQF04920.1 lasso RiPP family leader peptide-containing protein [Kitasatospora acidiphila]